MQVTDAPAALEDRVLDAALVLVARWGVAKTSLGDVAREAGCGRATIYRAFPGGKAHLFQALAERELSRFSAQVSVQLDDAASLEDALVAAIRASATFVAGHDALQFILAHEPGLVLPYLGFHQVDRLYRAASTLAGPHLLPHLTPEQTPWAVEWVVRLVLSYLFTPAAGTDLASERDARHLVRTYLLPAFAPTNPVPIGS